MLCIKSDMGKFSRANRGLLKVVSHGRDDCPRFGHGDRRNGGLRGPLRARLATFARRETKNPPKNLGKSTGFGGIILGGTGKRKKIVPFPKNGRPFCRSRRRIGGLGKRSVGGTIRRGSPRSFGSPHKGKRRIVKITGFFNEIDSMHYLRYHCVRFLRKTVNGR